MVKKVIFISIFLVTLKFWPDFAYSQNKEVQPAFRRGVWVSVFSEKKPLYSKKGILELIDLCKIAKINEIYLQIYQSGNAYYDSGIADKSKYKEIIKTAGLDTIDFLLKLAKDNNIKVFAWVNILCIGKNNKARILAKFKDTILTKDQYLRPSLSEDIKGLDKYYLRENQLFLEPGDPRVLQYSIAIIEEIIDKYPLLNGIHLDYIRYPSILPFLPGSRFNKYGLTYGYGENNLNNFKNKTGLDPLNDTFNESQFLEWDNWKRKQVSNLVEKIFRFIKKKSSILLVSCAVIPAAERAYISYFQDWSLWLEKGIVDYVVLMDYNRDSQLAKEIAISGLAHCKVGKVYIGLGLFLMKDDPFLFSRQYKSIAGLNPDGIVFYSYDDLSSKIIESIN
jgi:uncharacterized lipoprotein YddW (UPF0748 family)